ncbi:MAG TPA: hypothetical protein VHL79_16060 [Ramlibacter sp.]|jgi:hypothetical protein|nr:hypothetical protein [Ramlibacter sp.]
MQESQATEPSGARRDVGRRRLLQASLCAAVLGSTASARSSVPEPGLAAYVSQAHLIVVGVVERYAFHGVSREAPEERFQDFENDNERRTRRLDMFVRPQRVLLNTLGAPLPPLLRIPARTDLEGVKALVGATRIFLIRAYYPGEAGRNSGVFSPVRSSLGLIEEEEVRKALESKELLPRPGR